jgi:hypothetical protein
MGYMYELIAMGTIVMDLVAHPLETITAIVMRATGVAEL